MQEQFHKITNSELRAVLNAEIGHAAKCLWFTLLALSYTNNETGKIICKRPVSEIAAEIGVTPSTVRKFLTELHDAKLVKKIYRLRINGKYGSYKSIKKHRDKTEWIGPTWYVLR